MAILTSLISGITQKVTAGTETWSGGAGDSDWSSNRNWVGIGGAGANDDLVFDSASNLGNFAPLNDFPINTRFRSISISDSRYVITGNQIFLTAGITSTGANGGDNSFSPNIILDANQTFSASSTPFTLKGVINLNGHTLTVNGPIRFNGFINGSGTLIVNSGSKIAINGNSSNFGDTFLNGGALEVNGSLGRLSMQGGVLQGNGTLTAGIFSNFGSGGTISPGTGGNTRGTLISNGLVSLNSATTFHVDVQNSFVGGQCDRLHVFGSNIDLNSANLSVTVISPLTPGTQFTVMEQVGTGVITGQFSQGNRIDLFGQSFAITYTASSVVLTAL